MHSYLYIVQKRSVYRHRHQCLSIVESKTS